MLKLQSYAGRTHQGPFLEVNEDGYEVDLGNNLYFVLDGFGGVGIGDKYVETLRSSIRTFYTKVSGDPDSTFPFFYSPKYLVEGNALINAIKYSHIMLKKENSKKGMSDRGGSSIIAASLSENILTMVGSGNCTAYLHRRGALQEIMQPDSLEQYSRDEFQKYFSTLPMSGIGLFDDISLDIKELKISPGDLIIIMTDGVYSRITIDEMKFVFDKTGDGMNEKIDELINLSNSRGNLDNQTVLGLQF